MDQIIIRKAKLEDIETLRHFEQGVIAAERPFDLTLKSGLIHYYDLEEMIVAAHIEILVAEQNNQLIGSGYARIENAKPYLKHKTHAYLGFMYVVPEYRGKGVNREIIESLKKWAALQNITELRLDAYSNNNSAIKAYEKAGFNRHMIEMRMNTEEK
jgi:RimJ/RimL family protein N-acetyltransferase